jgi:hypothetical protein
MHPHLHPFVGDNFTYAHKLREGKNVFAPILVGLNLSVKLKQPIIFLPLQKLNEGDRRSRRRAVPSRSGFSNEQSRAAGSILLYKWSVEPPLIAARS